MATEFNLIISSCRKSYAAFQQLASRTDDALYHALGDLHALRSRMRNEPVLRAEFDELLQMNGGKSTNETLFLVKYVFFPHTLQPGPGHKSDITKASRYAKLINKALDQRIQPADFVAFARQQGIQRTALASRTSKRLPIRTNPPQSRKSPSSSSSVTGTASFMGPILAPLEPWFYSHALATRLADVVRRAKDQPQQLLLTI